MQYPKVKPRELKEPMASGVYADLDELIQLQFKVHAACVIRDGRGKGAVGDKA